MNPEPNRIVEPPRIAGEVDNLSLRPQRLDEFIGQKTTEREVTDLH